MKKMNTREIRKLAVWVLLIATAISLLSPRGFVYSQSLKPYVPSEEQVKALDALKKSYGIDWIVHWNEKTRGLSYFGGNQGHSINGSPKQAAKTFLMMSSKLFRADIKTLRLKTKSTMEKRHHLTFQQYYRNRLIEGAGITIHMMEDGNRIYQVQSTYFPDISMEMKPLLKSKEAAKIAFRDIGIPENFSGKSWTKLVVFPHWEENAAYLAWKISFFLEKPLGSWIYYVDARDGKVLKVFNDLDID